MKKNLLSYTVLATLFCGGAAWAIDCLNTDQNEINAKCTAMGYSTANATACSGKQVLKCPLNTDMVWCGDEIAASSSPTAKTCAVGDVLYNDLKCYDSKPSGKTGIAVVFDTTNKLALELDQDSAFRLWCPLLDYSADYVSEDCGNDSLTCGKYGKANTTSIVEHCAENGNSSDACTTKEGPFFCYNLTTGGVSAGTWFLPSASEWNTIYNNKSTLNTTISAEGGTTLPSDYTYYWTSTTSTDGYAFTIVMNGGDFHDTDCSYWNTIRCAIQYECPSYYSASRCPSKGVCAECGGKYHIAGCNGGYTLSGSTCVKEETCDESYALSSCPTNALSCDSCGGKYRIKDCNYGHGYSMSTRIAETCDLSCMSIQQTSCPDNTICTVCGTGYAQYGPNDETCSSIQFPLTSCPANGYCTPCSTAYTTRYVLHACKGRHFKRGNECVSINEMFYQ